MSQSACLIVLLLSSCASGLYPTAHNVSWKSTNFKTVLSWEPKPSSEYSYSVEFSQVGKDKQRTPHCIRSTSTVCDLSGSLTNLTACYTADVLSEPPLGATSDLTEFPHTSSPRFCPYKDTDIGKPDFEIQMNKDQRKITLNVTDPLTALFKNGRQLTIRDVFTDKLQYRVTYRKNKSSGKKVVESKSSVIEVTGLDAEESYCFSVQVFLPSRVEKQLGEMSLTKCSTTDNHSIIKEYSLVVIAGAVLFVVLVTGIIIAVAVICYKQRSKGLKGGRKAVPLQGV
ncbi:coagulation factor IIIa [Kryptolebias marmoratus]|uniref:Tissue factor n=1 Tax=Kryptolebias marmoratus TaxID=37003 RepID=A0A3Q3BIZ5_KRYMA|nr:coagulation factor IIIa [Kryptolebias marmoratus]